MRAWVLFLGITAACHSMQGALSILENSPFRPPEQAGQAGTGAEDGPASLARLQLRGITSIEGQYIFSVYNPDTRESKWMTEGREEDGLLIKNFDPETNSVVIHSESEDVSRQMQMNDFAASVAIRPNLSPVTPTRLPSASSPPVIPAVSPTGTLTRVQQSVQRPTRRNLETLRERRAELAEKLRKSPGSDGADTPGSPDNGKPNGETDGAQR